MRSINRNKNWSDQEVQFLRDNYISMSNVEVSLVLKRSVKAVQRKAHSLGIAKKTPVITITKVISSFKERGFTVVDTEYVNSQKPIKFICAKGHKSKLSWNKFSNGRGCTSCYYNTEDMYDSIKQSFCAIGYTLLLVKKDYIDSKQKLPFICNNKHFHEISWNNFGQGQRCAKCNPNVSAAEKELCRLIKEMGFDVVENTRELLEGLEVDIFVPSRNLAIEYCGLRWHGENFAKKSRNSHYNKYRLLLTKGIRLITIFEDEYLQKPDIVVGRIKAALGVLNQSIFARKTKFQSITLGEAKVFLNQHHLQGYSPCSFRCGLFYKGELVQVMTFGKVSRAHAGDEDVLELKRLASKADSIVVGGAQKLFKHAIKQFKGIGAVKSYCDMRWANPFKSIYEVLGFKLVGQTKYTPHYFKNQKRYRNYSLRKTIKERETGMTEWELRKKQGYDRIWDCGHKTYVFEIKGGE